jgi:hypothetical protein
MTQGELRLLSDEQNEEVRQAFRMGVRACLFLAREVETLYEPFAGLGDGKNCDAPQLMPLLEFSICPAMETLGDLLNGMDAVDDEAEHATNGAFEAVKKVIEKYGHK